MFIKLWNAHIEIVVSYPLAIKYLGTLAVLWSPPLLLELHTQFTH